MSGEFNVKSEFLNLNSKPSYALMSTISGHVASICIHVPTYILSKHDNCTDHGHPSQNGGKRGCSHGAGATAGTVEDSVG